MSAPRYRRRLATAALALLVSFTAAEKSAAQAVETGAGAAVRFDAYSFGTPSAAGASSVQLLTIPLAARVVVAPGLTIAARGAMARARVAAWGSDYTLSGLTDTELRATAALERGRTSLALAGVALVPSGHASLTLDEAVVAGTIASDLLPFAISNWGSGGGGGLELSAVRALDGGSAGVSAGYRMAREFRPFDALDAAYRPGIELRFGVALDRTLENDRTLALQLAYSRFGEDQLEGRGWLRAGQRVLALGSYTLPVRSAAVSSYGGVLYRSGGALGEFLNSWNLWGVLSRFAPPSETLVLLGSGARVPWRGQVLLPSIDFRLLRRGDGTGQGLLLGVGSSAELALGDGGVRLVPSARLRLGRLLVAQDATSSVRGLEVGLGIQLGGAR